MGLCRFYYARDLDRNGSLIGYIFMFNSCLINWKASLQHVVALFTTEAEFTVATKSVKEVIWPKGLIAELGYKHESVSIFYDNSNALHFCKNPAHYEKTNYIDIKLQFIRNKVPKG